MNVRHLVLGLLLIATPLVNAALPPFGEKALKFDASYETFEHQKVDLQSLIGTKPVYLKFWASWCLDCRHELPSLEKTYQKYRNQMAIYAVNLNINETDEAIKKLQQKNNLTIPILMDNNGTIAGNFEFKGTPFHVLINRKGEVVYTTYKDDEQLASQLALLAKDSAKIEATTEGVKQADTANTPLPNGVSLVYFSATWCDSYMKDVEPEISTNCVNAIHTIDKLYRAQPTLQLIAYVTHLWTEQSDLTDYRKRFSVPYKVNLDENNEKFRHFKANGYPTLVVFNNGTEIARFTEFSSSDKTLKEIEAAIKIQ
ncbi:TlpA family protein disulfide reductase [Cellvibrio sp. NN19]|uniref:TlpA family protein disulfide reductase n=1 Tax=Cellvibrio chitinivorans TaxID=3102792 RepID=UPI002B408204|nr:thioredoxin-like domain-containing protein [Cellvibrio sp. NN19]